MNKRSKSLDKTSTVKIHADLIRQKPLLHSLYVEFYKTIRAQISKFPVVEIGSGGGFLKKIIPQTITTDIVSADNIDQIEFAEKLSFKNNSIGSFVMLNVFHHIKNPQKALSEFNRCLKKGGVIIMVEPAISWWGKIIYKNFHREELNEFGGWKIKGKGRLTNANIALPYIVFIRDRQKFKALFPNLKIKTVNFHSPIAYLLSGGLTKFNLFSNLKYSYVKKIEEILLKISPQISMFMTIVIEKS